MDPGFESVDVDLKYTSNELDELMAYLEQFDIDEGGVYRTTCSWGENDQPDSTQLIVTVFSHPTCLRETKAESTQICAFRIHTRTPSITPAAAVPGFDIDVTWLKLKTWKRMHWADWFTGRADNHLDKCYHCMDTFGILFG